MNTKSILLVAMTAANFVHANTEQDEDDSILEIIEISAQLRAQDIKDVPLSVSYLSGEAIQQRLLKDTTALSAVAPNLKITQNAAEGTPPAVNIRGVGSVDYNTSTNSPIGVYVNGAAGGSANNQLVNLFDIEGVEVLRGPQGTLFGRNTTGGAVLVHTKRPEFDTRGYIDVGFAERDLFSAEGAYNTQVSENTAARLAFSTISYDYSTNNLHAPAPEADMRQTNIRLSLLSEWQAFELLTIANWGEWDGTVNPVGSIGVIAGIDPTTGAPTGFCSPEQAGSSACTDAFGFNDGSDDFYDVAVNTEVNNGSPHQSDYWSLYFEGKAELSENSYLVSITSFDHLDRLHFFNSDGSPARIAEGVQDVLTTTFTQELRYHLELDNSYLITGLYYLSNDIEQDNGLDFFRDFRALPGLFPNAAEFFYDNEIDTQAYALFSHFEYQLNTDTTVTLGLRYTDEQIDYHALGNINIPLFQDDQAGLTVPGWNVRGSIDDDYVTGNLALSHRLSDSNQAYISYSRGVKSGGYNGALINSADAAQRSDYGAERLDAYEIGFKSHAIANTRIHAAAFYYDYQDQQVFMNQAAIEPGALPLQLLTNVGESEIYGLELEVTSQLTENLNIYFSAGYLPEANLDSFVDALGNEITDNRLPFTSDWDLSAAIDYFIALPQGQLVLHLDVDYQSEFYFDQNQNPFAMQDDFALWNARIDYALGDWKAGIWVKNLTNEEYSHLKFDLINPLGMLQDFKGEARQVGVNASYRF